MLEKLTLRHFQAHRKLTIEFGKRVTCIVGPTDMGKSAILRALRWLCLNRIGSKRYISWWSKFTSVTLHVDGHVIQRRRGKENLYKLDGQVFKSFSTTVPEPIERLLQVTEENFQRQIDPPLWLASSPAQVGRELNKIVNLDVIDTTMENVARQKREAQSRVTSLGEIKTKLERESQGLSWIKQCRKDHRALQTLQEQQTQAREQALSLRELLREVQSHKQTTKRARECLQSGQIAVEKVDAFVELSRRVERLRSLLSRTVVKSDQIKEDRQNLVRLQTKLSQTKECPVCRQPLNPTDACQTQPR